MTVEQFWSYTLAESSMICLVAAEKRKHELELLAVHASWIMQMWSKSRVSPSRLLPWLRASDLSRFESKEEALAHLKQLRENENRETD
jgi:hypothetical protein